MATRSKLHCYIATKWEPSVLWNGRREETLPEKRRLQTQINRSDESHVGTCSRNAETAETRGAGRQLLQQNHRGTRTEPQQNLDLSLGQKWNEAIRSDQWPRSVCAQLSECSNTKPPNTRRICGVLSRPQSDQRSPYTDTRAPPPPTPPLTHTPFVFVSDSGSQTC